MLLYVTYFVSTKFDSCVPVLWIRHLATKLYQVNTVSPNPSLNTLLHIVTTVPGVDVKSVHKRRIGGTGIRSTRRMHSMVQTKRYSNHQQVPAHHPRRCCNFCPPRLNHSLQFRKLCRFLWELGEFLLLLMQKKPTFVPDNEAFNSYFGDGFLIPELKDGSEASEDEQADSSSENNVGNGALFVVGAT